MNVKLDSSIKALHPCKVCGSTRGVLSGGAGPHAKRIDCAGCGRFHNWLPLATAIEWGLFERDPG